MSNGETENGPQGRLPRRPRECKPLYSEHMKKESEMWGTFGELSQGSHNVVVVQAPVGTRAPLQGPSLHQNSEEGVTLGKCDHFKCNIANSTTGMEVLHLGSGPSSGAEKKYFLIF